MLVCVMHPPKSSSPPADEGRGGGRFDDRRGPPPPQRDRVVGGDLSYHSALGVANLLGQPAQPGMPADQITALLARKTRSELYDYLAQVQLLLRQNPHQARELLVGNPQLSKALFQMQVILGMVNNPLGDVAPKGIAPPNVFPSRHMDHGGPLPMEPLGPPLPQQHAPPQQPPVQYQPPPMQQQQPPMQQPYMQPPPQQANGYPGGPMQPAQPQMGYQPLPMQPVQQQPPYLPPEPLPQPMQPLPADPRLAAGGAQPVDPRRAPGAGVAPRPMISVAHAHAPPAPAPVAPPQQSAPAMGAGMTPEQQQGKLCLGACLVWWGHVTGPQRCTTLGQAAGLTALSCHQSSPAASYSTLACSTTPASDEPDAAADRAAAAGTEGPGPGPPAAAGRSCVRPTV